MKSVFAHIEAHADQYVERLRTLCRQPSISTFNVGMAETAELVLQMLRDAGLQARTIPIAGGYPIVYGELAAGARKTLGLYNHYDVQPPDPLDQWQSDPFAGDIRDGYIYARGVSDNKGDLVARLCAVESYIAVRGRPPVNLKFIIEGEEEIGSPHLGQFADEHTDLIAADGYIWEGGSRDSRGRPEIMLGCKGIAYVELSTTAAKTDTHSMWGPIVPNAAWRLVWALNTLKDQQERILVRGLYDKVRPPTQGEIDAVTPLEEDALRVQWGLPAFLGGHTGKDLAVRLYFEPTCTICGIWSGFTTPGSMKTVLPNRATAYIDFRLVPDQLPEDVVPLLRQHLDEHGFPDVQARLLGSLYPAKTPVGSHLAQVLIETAREVYGAAPVIQPISPGSGPMYRLCQKYGMPAGSSGVANANSRYHAPNENISIADFILGIKHVAAIIERF